MTLIAGKQYHAGHYVSKYHSAKTKCFSEAKFVFGYENLNSEPIIFENFGYIDLRSLLLLTKLVRLEVKNMQKDKGSFNYLIIYNEIIIEIKLEQNTGKLNVKQKEDL